MAGIEREVSPKDNCVQALTTEYCPLGVRRSAWRHLGASLVLCAVLSKSGILFANVRSIFERNCNLVSEPDKLLTPNESQLLQHLVSGKSLVEAAEAMGMNYHTVYRWMKRPHVQAAYEELTKDIATLVRKQIEGLSNTAIAALKDILESQSMMAKVQGVKIVLDRLDPETLKVPQAQAETQTGPIPAELLPYLEEPEIATIEQLLARAQERKMEAEQKITPIRKQA